MNDKMNEAVADAITTTRCRVTSLMRSKADLKKAGLPKAIRKAIEEAFAADAVKLVIAEKKIEIAGFIMDNPPLYGRDVAVSYNEACESVLGEML